MKLLLPFAFALIIPVSPTLEIEAPAVRKCTGPGIMPGHVVSLDDVIILDSEDATGDPDSSASVMPPQEDVLRIDVRCLSIRSPEGVEGWVKRSAVVILTRSGAREVAERQLADLVEEQRLNRERTGAFAETLSELAFTDRRIALGIKMTMSGEGWQASVAVPDPGFECRVAVGDAVTPDSGLQAGIPTCVMIDPSDPV
jgi:hypothetical protein